jgi:SAM-dependent methyltransferase
MPQYLDLPPIVMHPRPEEVIRGIIARTVGLAGIRSILDVGSGHGGVFDYDFWTRSPLERRATCDIHSVREMDPVWETGIGVDVRRLGEFYGAASFDLVQCMEVLEHVSDSRAALEQLCRVARKLVIITSADERHHGYDEQGRFDEESEQARIERVNPYQKYVGQPRVSDLQELGFVVRVEQTARRQLVAWKVIDDGPP